MIYFFLNNYFIQIILAIKKTKEIEIIKDTRIAKLTYSLEKW